MANDMPSRMVFAGRRWRVTDTPTLLRPSAWSAQVDGHTGLNGWRFQGTNDDGLSLVFDVFRGEDCWHVHRSYE